MSTNSTIAILKKDGTVSSIYCHSDGYLSYNGMFLVRYYQDSEKVNRLINLGSISSLDKEVDIPQGVNHTFDKRISGITTFYGRDRGEKGTEKTKYKSIEEYISIGDFSEYNYIYNENKKNWFFLNLTTGKAVKLLPLLMKSKEITRSEDIQFIADTILAIKSEKLKNKIEKNIPEKLNINTPKKIKV